MSERRYAEGTAVPAARSRDEIYRLLDRYGAQQRLVGDDPGRVLVAFVLRGRAVRIDQALPARRLFSSQAAHEREIRRRWRVLVLLLKGRLELVADGAESVEQAFMPYLVLPDGSTAGAHVVGWVEEAARTGRMPETVLPGMPAPARVIALGAGKEGQR